MSIKKLFGSTNKSRNYLAETNEKNAFTDVESAKNMQEIAIKQETFVPQIDYSKPENFAKFGSAEQYSKTAVERIIDYYPYDGSEAERQEFLNNSTYLDLYVLEQRYPTTTGYAHLSVSGWGSLSGSKVGSYGQPETLEYIQVIGGPHTASSGMIGTNLEAIFLSLNKLVNILTRAIVVDISRSPEDLSMFSKISFEGFFIGFA